MVGGGSKSVLTGHLTILGEGTGKRTVEKAKSDAGADGGGAGKKEGCDFTFLGGSELGDWKIFGGGGGGKESSATGIFFYEEGGGARGGKVRCFSR